MSDMGRRPAAAWRRVMPALLAGALLAALLAWWTLDLGRWLSLAQMQAWQVDVATAYRQQPVAVLCAYFGAYVLLTALSIPGATVLTLLGGAVFGLAVGTLVVSFASTLGATLAMLSARHLLRDAVTARLGPRLAAVIDGLRRDGAWYLFTLRLWPVVPFVALNLVMGLTPVRTVTFAWVSQLGMLAGTLVYVNAGTQLAQLRSAHGLLSPGLLLALALMGVLPLVARRLVPALQARRRLAPWAQRRPRRFDRNLVVIGGGAAGLVASHVAATLRARVTLVEGDQLGGDCLHHGCVPSKALIRAATLAHQARQAAAHGVHADALRVDFAQVMQGVAAAVQAVAPHDSPERYRALGVEVLHGQARLVDPWHVQVTAADGGQQLLSTRAVVVATGAQPWLPPLPGLQASGCLTSDTLWSLRELPRQLLVLGGGPVGCELAQAFARLGSQVTLLEQGTRLLPLEDDDSAQAVAQALQADGVRVLTAHRVQAVERDGDQRVLVADHEGRECRVAGDQLLCALGRRARLQGFGLEELGLLPPDGDTGHVLPVDAFQRTALPHILAAGDVCGPWQLTHAASLQAWHAAVNGLLGGWWSLRVDTRVVPRCTFVDPEVAHVGLTEQAAQAQGVAFECTRFDLAELDRALIDGCRAGWVKVLTVPGRDRLLGATVVGAHAGELIAPLALALRRGLGLRAVLGTVHAYPTWAEAARQVAGRWQVAHAPQSLLRMLQRLHTWRRG